MKAPLKAPLAALLFVLSAACAHAQQPAASEFITLTNPSQDSAATIANIGDISGNGNGVGLGYGSVDFSFDSSGNLFYFAGENEDYYADDQVDEITAASGYSTFEQVSNFGGDTYGAFITISGTTAYYGDGNNIYASSTTKINPVQTPNAIAAMSGNYDLAFSGTTPFVSANLTGTDNGVYTLNPGNGSYQRVLNTDGDYSGPIAFDAAGDLIYGMSGAAVINGGTDVNLYVFNAASVNAAITSGTALNLANATSIITGSGGNSNFAIIGNELYDAFDPFGTRYSTLTGYNLSLANPTGVSLATVTNDSYNIAGLAAYNGQLTLAVSDAGTFTDFIQIKPVPEPGVEALGIIGAGLGALVAWRRKRRAT
jgi:hypothetical protein